METKEKQKGIAGSFISPASSLRWRSFESGPLEGLSVALLCESRGGRPPGTKTMKRVSHSHCFNTAALPATPSIITHFDARRFDDAMCARVRW